MWHRAATANNNPCFALRMALAASFMNTVAHGSFGAFTADSSNPTSASSMMPAGVALPRMSPQSGSGSLSQESTEIVAGLVDSFLHRQRLQSGERDCLVEGAGDVAGQLASASQQVIVLFKQVLGSQGSNAGFEDMASPTETKPEKDMDDGAGSISAMVDAIQQDQNQQGSDNPYAAPEQHAIASTPSPTSDGGASSLSLFYKRRRLQLAGLGSMGGMGAAGGGMGGMGAPGGGLGGMGGPGVGVIMQLGVNVRQIVKLARKTVKKCVKGDALLAFKTAERHMQDLNYVGGHLMAHGADIFSEFADAVIAYDHHDPRSFGADIGKALRKVFLSSSSASALPEGLPGRLVLANVTAGFLNGFFGKGMALDVNTPQSTSPIHIDLHECVSRNLKFFQYAFGSTMFFYAQKASQGGDAKEKEKGEMGAALAFAMFKLPSVLRRCNINEDQEDMLKESIQVMGKGMQFHLELPGEAPTRDRYAKQMETTIQDWEKMQWYDFGKDLGKLLQDMALTVYAQKYTIDSSGALHRLLGTSEVTNAYPATKSFGAFRGVPFFIVACFLVVLLAVKGQRVARRMLVKQPQASEVDVEVEAAE